MEDFLYDIKTASTEDVIMLFKTIDISEDTASYMYSAMANRNLFDFVDQITDMYISKGVYSIAFDIIEGWSDNHKIFSRNKEDLRKKLREILIKLIRSDEVICENFYINILEKEFSINYYAETMVG